MRVLRDGGKCFYAWLIVWMKLSQTVRIERPASVTEEALRGLSIKMGAMVTGRE